MSLVNGSPVYRYSDWHRDLFPVFDDVREQDFGFHDAALFEHDGPVGRDDELPDPDGRLD